MALNEPLHSAQRPCVDHCLGIGSFSWSLCAWAWLMCSHSGSWLCFLYSLSHWGMNTLPTKPQEGWLNLFFIQCFSIPQAVAISGISPLPISFSVSEFEIQNSFIFSTNKMWIPLPPDNYVGIRKVKIFLLSYERKIIFQGLRHWYLNLWPGWNQGSFARQFETI